MRKVFLAQVKLHASGVKLLHCVLEMNPVFKFLQPTTHMSTQAPDRHSMLHCLKSSMMSGRRMVT